MANDENVAVGDNDKINCRICGAAVHVIKKHLEEEHSDISVEKYRERYPDAEILSPFALAHIKQRKAAKMTANVSVGEATSVASDRQSGLTMKALHEVFDLGAVPAAMNARGQPIMVSVLGEEHVFGDMVPERDPNYIFPIDILKYAIIGMEMNMPTYFWGMHGTGKTTLFEQIAAHTKRPFFRIQHTVNTEESHILGQWTVRDHATHFELGPLALAMIHGCVYCADEYDVAMPSVVAVYQPVLEGKALFIKEAPPEHRVIRPHKDFRFVATGNTNGGGDDTGLYQGTQIQNAANYSRFGITVEVPYMEPDQEAAVVASQSGIAKPDAMKIVKFAGEVRKQFGAAKISATVSPRELINSAKIGLVRGSDWRGGLALGFINRLSRTDREVVDQYAQRVFG